ncbi:putative DNA-directed RNA polymerase delta subunit [Clostridium sp. CAG:762]|nr:putative DNA-directed RNA polymerase delta subunit [Clostridium sp. CAG:762]
MSIKKMPKEELELLSYTQIAKMYLEETKKTLTTKELFKEVCDLLELSENEYEEKIADFFQSLTTSKEFILLTDGKWDLKSNHAVKIDLEEEEEEIEPKTNDEDDIEPEEDDDIDIDDYDATDDDYEDDELTDLSIIDEDEIE